MYAPVRDYFTGHGYTVRAEVKSCDLAAELDGELVVVEFKKNFSLKLVYQALERLSLTEQVYVAIPRPRSADTPEYKGMKRLMRTLALGLITVAMDSPVKTVDVLLYPEPGRLPPRNTKRRQILLKELNGRNFDLNSGGASRSKVITAYTERCIKIACIIKCRGAKRPKELVHDYGCEKDAGVILQSNFYGWFERVEKGVYGLSELGEQSLSKPNKPAEYYLGVYK
ncbi:MAG: DUF2161 family putative PD-(D/E)XK-type phosphodiesterase [Defluviitaleaceae bacterium]|nr:DUF2161 family putative PD-(D/E)XK-type phosphodiesterase [Defluviitaleaceae bacterium]